MLIDPIRQGLDIYFESFEDLRDHPLWLLNQCQQDVLGIDLIVSVALNDLRRALRGVLCPLREAVKPHHL